MVYDISKKILEILKAEPALSMVKVWKEPKDAMDYKDIAITVGCNNCTFSKYTNNKDECYATFLIYIYIPKAKEEEFIISELADEVRLSLCDHYSVGDKASSGFVEKISFGTATDQSDVKLAVLSFKVKSYTGRRRPLIIPTIEKIKTIIGR